MRGQSNAAVDTGLVWFVCVCVCVCVCVKTSYTPHKDAPFIVFLCYQPPRDVPYRELDDEVGVGQVARTFVTRKDRKSLVITEMIIH